MNTKVLSFFLLLSTSLALTAAPSSPSKKGSGMATSPKIAVVDVRRMLSQDKQVLSQGAGVSHQWRDLYTSLQDTIEPANKELSDLQKQYKEKVADIEKLQKSGLSSREALQKKYQEEIAPLEYRLQAQTQQMQNFTYSEMGKIQNIIAPKIQNATDVVIKKGGWDFAVNRESIISSFSSASSFDITADVLAALNAEYAQEKAAKEAKK